MKPAKFTKLEIRLRDLASRRARRQLVRVPWSRFRKSYDDYIRWQAYALWVRAVVDSGGGIPHWLEKVLRKRCRGFLERRARSTQRQPLDVRLREWVDDQVFEFAKEEGWLDALAFYAFRDVRSQGIWSYWENCESEWKKRRPKSFPTFSEWWRSALNWKLQGDFNSAVVAKTVEKYIDCLTLVSWLRPLTEAPRTQLPSHVTRDLKRECPALLEFLKRQSPTVKGPKPRGWPKLLSWCQDHVLSDAKREGWRDSVLYHASVHPRWVSVADYTLTWRRSPFEQAVPPFATFSQWKRAAENHARTGRK